MLCHVFSCLFCIAMLSFLRLSRYNLITNALCDTVDILTKFKDKHSSVRSRVAVHHKYTKKRHTSSHIKALYKLRSTHSTNIKISGKGGQG